MLPNKIIIQMIKKHNISNIVYKIGSYALINLVIGISVVLKNYFNYYLMEYVQEYIIQKIFNYESKSIPNLLLSEIFMFLAFSIIYWCFLIFYNCYKSNYRNNELRILFNEEKDDNHQINYERLSRLSKIEKDKKISVHYLAGYTFIKTDSIYSLITINGLLSYILSILTNSKIIFILFINFFSRIQKLKFKTEYKERITNPNALFLNFLLSFGGYFLIYCCIYIMISNIFDNKKDDKDKDNYSYIIERLILISIIIDFLYVHIVSMIFYFKEDAEDITIYICIALTGSINFLFYDF